jgi:adenosylmethionine-8-amino-7-oxononanoate aminotransferase
MKDPLSLDRRHLWHPYTQAVAAPEPILIQSGRGARLVGSNGREYLDLVSSWWVNLHGHAHPVIADAVAAQARQLEQVIFADFTHQPAIELARRIAELLPGDLERIFFSDDGSTAVEVALKIAHQYWRNRGEERGAFVAFEGGYHGDTLGAMSAGASSGFFRAWEGLLFPVEFAPYPATWEGDGKAEEREAASLVAIDQIFERHQGRITAVVIEPLIQGAGGMRMCSPRFLARLAEKVRSRGSLLVFDEVMTGFGRTGALFACLKAGVAPDLICLSKGLTGGFMPLALTACADRIYEAFLGQSIERAFLHGHSYTANPLGCAAALASLDLLLAPGCGQRIAAIEAIHRARLSALASHPRVSRPRITGTIAAFEVAAEEAGYGSSIGPKLKELFFQRGLLIRPLGNVLYLMPPYCIEEADLHHAWDGIAEVLEQV